uniref:LRAT domain-containing protein n=1 Tax=Peronospora matthiolae TaxID=2874970 RepID=A0AAV1TI55_9STRA
MGGVYTRVHRLSSLRPGDHICIWDYSRWPFSYQHHGIIWAASDHVVDIRVCHVWSPLQSYREAQADSCFRISTLEEFLYNRSVHDLRLVEHHTSAFRDFCSKWGEVHRGKSDLPEVVLARCKFLLGLGKGDFNIFTQNCEHAAHWCKTGYQWSKQLLTKAGGRVPFEKRLAKEDVDALEQEIQAIKEVSRILANNVLKLSGSTVFLRVKDDKYLRIREDGCHVELASHFTEVDTGDRTTFRLECYSKAYNCVKVSFFHEESGRYLFSRSTFSCFRDLRMKKANCLRGTSGMRWEYSVGSGGHLNSMNQHRRYIGVRDDGLVVDVSLREHALSFELVPVKATTWGRVESSVPPPDLKLLERCYDHAKNVQETRSQSMLELEDERRGLAEMKDPV